MNNRRPARSLLTLIAASAAACHLFGGYATADTGARGSIPVVADSAIVIGTGAKGPYWLSGYFILRNSETISDRNGTRLERGAYTLDVNRGRITFAEPLEFGDSLYVSFKRLTWGIPNEWTLNSQRAGAVSTLPNTALYTGAARIIPTATTAAPIRGSSSSVAGIPRRNPSLNSISWQGFKSFSVTSATGRGTEWSQGMELSVDGELTRGLNLRAAVSDRFAGVTSQNRSPGVSRVGDLDRFFIEVQSHRFYGRMGQLAVTGAETGGTARQLSGARLRWTDDSHSLAGFLGRPSGRMVRRRLSVTPLVAGPYYLADHAGGRGDILPGSVVIWLDGRRLSEGADRDFMFSPTQGAITFNPSLVITSRSVVVAEFEQALDSYRRTLAGADWSWNGENSSSAFTLQWEGDDPDRPLIGNLSQDQKQALAANPEGEVSVPAADYRGTREGDYSLSITAAGDSVFTYVGPDNGEWRVTFEYVGPGKGRYRHLAAAAYEFVGEGQGSYEPTVTLGAPVSHLAIGESFRWASGRIGTFQGQWLGHLDDPNRLAASSSQFRSEHLLAWTLSSRATTTDDTDQLHLEWRHRGDALERGQVIDDFARFSSRWGLVPALFDSSRNEYEVSASSSAQRPVQIALGSGILSYDELQAWRLSLLSRTRFTSRLSSRTEWRETVARRGELSVGSQDRARVLGTSFTYELGSTAVTSGWREDRTRDHDHMFAWKPQYSAERWIEIRRSGASAKYRWDDTRDSTAALPRRTREASLVMPLAFHPAASGRLTAARGVTSTGDSPYEPYYRGGLAARWRPFTTASLTADMRLDYARTGIEREVYLPTRPGEGQYRLERGEYVPDAHGDYRRVVSRSDELGQSAYDGRQKIVLQWRPQIQGWRWNLESRRERLGRHDPDRFRPATWLAPWTSVDWATAPGARAECHDYHRLGVRPNAATQIALDWITDVTVFGLDRERNRRERIGGSARRQVSDRWYVQAGGEYEKRSRTGGLAAEVQAAATTWRTTVGGVPAGGINWSVEGRRRIDRELLATMWVRLLGVKSRFQFARGPVNLLVESDAAWVTPGGDLPGLSALLAEGRPLGFSMMDFCELRWQLPGKLTLKSRVIGDVRERSPNRWRWEVQTIARL